MAAPRLNASSLMKEKTVCFRTFQLSENIVARRITLACSHAQLAALQFVPAHPASIRGLSTGGDQFRAERGHASAAFPNFESYQHTLILVLRVRLNINAHIFRPSRDAEKARER